GWMLLSSPDGCTFPRRSLGKPPHQTSSCRQLDTRCGSSAVAGEGGSARSVRKKTRTPRMAINTATAIAAMIAKGAVPTRFRGGRGGGVVIGRPSGSKTGRAGRRAPFLLRIKGRAQIAFAQVGQNDDDEFAGTVRALGHLHSRPRRGPRADAAQDS